jgi:hypothetical protein
MTFDPMFITTNFFVQAQRAAELMAEHDAKMVKVIEDLQAMGYTMSIHY